MKKKKKKNRRKKRKGPSVKSLVDEHNAKTRNSEGYQSKIGDCLDDKAKAVLEQLKLRLSNNVQDSSQ